MIIAWTIATTVQYGPWAKVLCVPPDDFSILDAEGGGGSVARSIHTSTEYCLSDVKKKPTFAPIQLWAVQKSIPPTAVLST
jgi:hypothetical protein